MKNKRPDNPWLTRVLALLFAILLFMFVYYENTSRIRSTSPTDGASITSVEVVTDVPITIDIDQELYFVSGIPETATIRLEGPQAILTQTLATQNFEIATPNLTELGIGTHIVELEAEGLSSSLNYSIMPTEVTVTIEEKRVESYPVNVEFNEASLAAGYEAGAPQLSQQEVQISGAQSMVDRVNEVSVLVLPDGNDLTDDIEMTLPVLVFDANGELLDVNINPNQLDVVVPIRGTEKSVPIVLRESGTEEPGYEYELQLAQGQPENVTITGNEEALEEANNFPVEVDVSGVTESTIRTIPLEVQEGLDEVSPEQVDVVIRVTESSGEDPGQTEDAAEE